MARLYGSSPVEQAALQTRSSRLTPAPCCSKSAGSATFERYSKCCDSRKKSVLLVVTRSTILTSSPSDWPESTRSQYSLKLPIPSSWTLRPRRASSRVRFDGGMRIP